MALFTYNEFRSKNPVYTQNNLVSEQLNHNVGETGDAITKENNLTE